MSELPQIMASNPQVIPAKEEIVYDKYWMTQLHIIAPSPTEEARLIAVIKPCRDVTVNVDGKDVVYKEIMPDVAGHTVVVPKMFERMMTRSSLAQTMGAVLMELIAIGQEKGIIE